MRKLIVTLIAAVATLATATFAYADTNNEVSKYGLYKPEGSIFILSEDTTTGSDDSGLVRGTLPSKYDTRTLGYNKYITIRNQYTTGMCWACSASTAAERSWLQEQMNNGVAVENMSHPVMSPPHLAYFYYNRQNDPLGNTAGDLNVINTSYPWPTAASKYWKNAGGSNQQTLFALSGWMGLANDSVAPLNQFNNGTTVQSIDSSYAYEAELILENAQSLYSRDATKQAIIDHGAVVADYTHFDDVTKENYLGTDGKSYYCGTSKESNHAITIVGWDDNYNRNNFSGSDSGLPSVNGAWIVQNSWGTSWGEGGYFYISYEDATLGDPIYYDMQPADTYDYNYYYDGNALAAGIPSPKGLKYANIYEVKGSDNEVLEAVGFSDLNEDNDAYYYTITIYTDVEDEDDLTASNEAVSWNVQTNGYGFHTFELPEGKEVSLKKGDKYAVCVAYNYHKTAGSQDTTKIATEMEYKVSTLPVYYYTGNQAGQSFIDEGDGWVDMNSYGWTARIKAFTTDASAPVAKDYERIYGMNRYETAIKVADRLKELAPDSLTNGKYDTIVVACGSDYPDALAGGYLAAVNDAPIITAALNDSKTETDAYNYIKNNLNIDGGGKVYLLGGTGVVSSNLETRLKGLVGETRVKRLGGANRFETNLRILEEAGYSSEVLVCSAYEYADSLSASGTILPILLVGNSLTAAQTEYLNNSGSSDAYIIGGTGAVSSTVESQLKGIFTGANVYRLGGKNRYETSFMVAELFWSGTAKNAVVAYSMDFPDGLAGGPLSKPIDAPLLLVNDSNTSYATQYVANHGTNHLVVLGGPALISNASVKKILG